MKMLTALALSAAVTALAPSGILAQQFNYAAATPALTLDPHATSDFTTTALFRQFYDSVIDLDDELGIRPGIATSWEFDGDKTWRFSLRDDVTFHDGSPMTAEDVAFSIMRQSKSPRYSGLFGDIVDAKAVDETTVDVTSNVGDPILPQRMARLFVMSKAWAEEHDVEEATALSADAGEVYTLTHAMGTGPLELVSHDPNSRTVMKRFDGYWRETAGNAEDFVLTPIGSAPTRTASLLSGEVDMIMDLPLQDIARIESASGFTVGQTAQLTWMELEMDGTRDVALGVTDKDGNPLEANPFKDVRVRRAFAHAIDAEAIVERVMDGNGRVVGIPSVPGLAGHQEQLDQRWPTDLNLARELLAEAGYPDGFGATLNCPLERYVNTEEICRAVASMLARIGVDVRINAMVWPEFASMLVNGPNSSFHLIGAGPNSWNGQDTFSSIIMTRNKDTGVGIFNWALWSNADVDRIGTELKSTFDEAERDRLFAEGFAIARDEVHAVYLHQAMISWGMGPDVETATVRPDFVPLLADVIVSK